MSRRTWGAGVAALCLLAGLSAAWQFGSTTGGSEKALARPSIADEGDRRHAVLWALTERYVSRGSGVSAGMRAGSELAPVAFLNDELRIQGAKWRVETTGANASAPEWFDIS